MKFDVYFPFRRKDGTWCPGVKPHLIEMRDIVGLVGQSDTVFEKCKSTDKNERSEAKKQLPAVAFMGRCMPGHTRAAANMTPTQYIMIDIDHVEDAQKAAFEARERLKPILSIVLLIHITPSTRGLRIVMKCPDTCSSITEALHFISDEYRLYELGDVDEACTDFSRTSFLVPASYYTYFNTELANKELDTTGPLNIDVVASPEEKQNSLLNDDVFTDEEKQKYDTLAWRGENVKMIIEKWVEAQGEPESGSIHQYYNNLIKYFRCLVDNDKRALLYLLPRFGHSADECWSSIKSICKVNTLSRLPKELYFFLKDNGLYVSTSGESNAIKNYMMDDSEVELPNKKDLPWMPPVFRDFVATAPADFVPSVINSLLPVLGTLTSYVGARYPYDDRIHTTSFFSIIYAPQGTGKGFVERFMSILFEQLRMRDFVQQERENIYLRAIQRKGANDKAPELPHTSLRIIPPKNSEAEFLQKQRDNHGYHMFTFAAEMDSWAKGVRAAGGNKDDMIRIAWDNGEYGQQFKSASTFKGTVNLYWNVLITGTIAQVETYFKNVENGLVSRCSFTSIDNQEFALPPKWRQLTKKSQQVIKAFVERCDFNTYEQPLALVPTDLEGISDEDFDKEIDWRFRFKQRQIIDCSWVMPTIEKFHDEQLKKAVSEIDKARDVFRRRVAVRGFRLAMICHCLWLKPTKKDLEKCCDFIKWWMDIDIENMLKLWGAKYNEIADVTPTLTQRSVFSALGEQFTRNDVYIVCLKQGIKTPVRRILFEWKKVGYIEKIDKENYKKTTK